MNRHPDPELLALYIGGDLSPADLQHLTVHLAACADCRHAATDFDSVLQVFRSAVPEPSEQDLQSVRRAVGARLGQRRRPMLWSLGSAAAALSLIVLVVTFLKPPAALRTEVALQLPMSSRPLHPALQLPEAKQRRAIRRSVRVEAGLRTVNFVPRGDGTLQLRLTTADPSVVILLPPTTESMVEP